MQGYNTFFVRGKVDYAGAASREGAAGSAGAFATLYVLRKSGSFAISSLTFAKRQQYISNHRADWTHNIKAANQLTINP